jgi:hypothetical protein
MPGRGRARNADSAFANNVPEARLPVPIRDRGMIGEGRDHHPPLDAAGHAARVKGARRATHEDEVRAAGAVASMAGFTLQIQAQKSMREVDP